MVVGQDRGLLADRVTAQHDLRTAFDDLDHVGGAPQAASRDQQAVVLHQQYMFFPGKISAGRDPDRFFFFSHFDQTHSRIIIRHLQQINEPGFRQRGQGENSGILDALINRLGVGQRNRHIY